MDVGPIGAFFGHDLPGSDARFPVKLIAEPWDLGEGGYQVGKLSGWMDGVERQVSRLRCVSSGKGDMGLHSDIALGLAGSAICMKTTRRPPSASVNFVTAHDGFTLQDLVSYEQSTTSQRRRQPRRQRRQQLVELRRGGSDRGRRNHRTARTAKAHFWCSLMLAQGFPHDFRRRRVEPLSARQQTKRLLSGSELSWYHWDWTRCHGIPGIRAASGPISQAASEFSSVRLLTT